MENILRKVTSMQFRVRDVLDQPNHADAQALNREIQNLVNEVKAKRGMASLDDRIKRIDQILSRIPGDVMDSGDSDEFRDTCQDLRQDIRKL
jgi:hypothetical protein